MEVCDQEGDVVALSLPLERTLSRAPRCADKTYFDRFPPKDEESLRPLCQKSRKLMHKDILNLVRLLDLDGNADTVHARFDQDALVLIAAYAERIEQELRRGPRFDLRHIVSFRGLAGEIG